MTADTLLFSMATATLGAYICRLDALTWRRHRPVFVVMHLIQAWGCIWVMSEAVRGMSDPGLFLVVGSAASWIVISYTAWRNGPPSHAWRRKRESPARSSDSVGDRVLKIFEKIGFGHHQPVFFKPEAGQQLGARDQKPHQADVIS